MCNSQLIPCPELDLVFNFLDDVWKYNSNIVRQKNKIKNYIFKLFCWIDIKSKLKNILLF